MVQVFITSFSLKIILVKKVFGLCLQKGKLLHNTNSCFLNTIVISFTEFIDNRFWTKFKKKQFLKSKIVLLRSLNIFGTKKIGKCVQYFAVIKNCFSHRMVPLGTFK